MAVPPSRPGNLAAPLLPGLALLLLSACSVPEGFPPPCPVPSIPRDFNDLERYRGTGRDLTDQVLEGRVTGVTGSCKRDGDGTVVTTVSVGIELARGPASTSRRADVGYFVAVSEGDRILDKQSFRLRADFPANAERLRLTGDEVELRLPVTAAKSAAAYRISVGFELTPAELAINRERIARQQAR